MRTGRCAIPFIVGGFYALWISSILLIRDKVKNVGFLKTKIFVFFRKKKIKGWKALMETFGIQFFGKEYPMYFLPCGT